METLGLRWSGQVDLNHRPHGPEPCALTRLSYAPIGRDADSRGSASDRQTARPTGRFPRGRNRLPGASVPFLMIKRFISLLFVAAAPLLAQQPAEPFKANVNVNLVLLDAVVTDARGNQILGLGKDDFVVKENGVPQAIDSVDYFTTRKLLNAPEKGASFPVERVHEERYLIIFFDKPLSIGMTDPTRIARYELGRYLDQHMHPEDRIAVVGHDVRLKVYCDFTNDRKTIQRALDDATRYGRGLMSASDAPAGGASILRNIDLDRMMNQTGTQY